MIEFKKAIVEKIEKSSQQIEEVLVNIEDPCKKALNYIGMTGSLNIGDVVLVNTTACSLNLGTGGYHYIMGNFSKGDHGLISAGHGMKLKYTPNQINVLFSEEQESPLHDEFHKELNLRGKLVITGELHSMLMPLCAHLKFCTNESIKVACIITDFGALPVWMSKNISTLKDMGLLDKVISTGNAFGGDHECVNIYTALQLATDTLNMDAIIITMGPGIMGTGTPFGFSGLELGFYVDFSWVQGANALCVPRISFKDTRNRHYGISHHFINTFQKIVQNPVPIIIPSMEKKKMKYILGQLRESGLSLNHPIAIRDGRNITESLKYYKLKPTTMGRGLEEEPEFFYSHGSVVEYGLSKL